MAETLSKRLRDACDKLTRQVCVKMLTGIGHGIDSYASQEQMQDYVFAAVLAGDLHPRDILGADYNKDGDLARKGVALLQSALNDHLK